METIINSEVDLKQFELEMKTRFKSMERVTEISILTELVYRKMELLNRNLSNSEIEDVRGIAREVWNKIIKLSE